MRHSNSEYFSYERDEMVVGALNPTLRWRQSRLSNSLSKLWFEDIAEVAQEIPQSVEMFEVLPQSSESSESPDRRRAPRLGSCFVLEWTKSYELEEDGVVKVHIAAERLHLVSADNGARVVALEGPRSPSELDP